MTRLHAVTDSAGIWRWCGPVAIAAATGVPYTVAVDMIEFASGQPFRGWTHISTIHTALARDGRRVVFERVPDRPTLKAYLQARTQTHRRHVEIIRVSAHFVAVHASTYVDSVWSGCAVGSTQDLIKNHPRKRVTYRIIFEE
mgnify:FL=1